MVRNRRPPLGARVRASGFLVGEEVEYRLRIDMEKVYPHEPSDAEWSEYCKTFKDFHEKRIRAALDTAFKGQYDLRLEGSTINAWHPVSGEGE